MIGQIFQSASGLEEIDISAMMDKTLEKSVIQTESLSKRYGSFLALDDVSINVLRGEIYGFLGPNGAGKTTLITILLSLAKPTRGNVSIFNQPLKARQPELFLHIGVVGEEQHFYEDMTAFEYLALFAKLLKVPDSSKRIQSLLERLNMWEWREHVIRFFSHGMRQKIALARALLHQPALLLLDEPVSGLDPYGIKEIRELLLELRQQGTTIFISSHVLSEVERLADRVGILDHGRLLAEGPIAALSKQIHMTTIVEVELVSIPDQLVRVLAGLPYVEDIQSSDNKLIVETNTNIDHRTELSKVITTNEGVIIGMKVHQPSLEETFITLTERNLSMIANLVQS